MEYNRCSASMLYNMSFIHIITIFLCSFSAYSDFASSSSHRDSKGDVDKLVMLMYEYFL